MKLDTKFSRPRSEQERLEREKNTKKVDPYRYGDDGYIIEDEPKTAPKVRVTQKTASVRQEEKRRTSSSAGRNTAARRHTAQTHSSETHSSHSHSSRTHTQQKTQREVNQRKTVRSETQTQRKPEKKAKRQVGSGFLWLLLLIATCGFVYSFWRLPMFSEKIFYLVAGAAALLLFVTGAATSIFSPKNIFQKFINVTLAICMTVAAVLLPYYEARVSSIIDGIFGNQVRISVYALTEEYKNANAPKYSKTIDVPAPGKTVKLEDYRYAVYGTFLGIDRVNQEYAMSELSKEFGDEVAYHYDYTSARQATEALYNNEIDVIVMSESFVSVIEDTEGYETFSQDTQILYTFYRTMETDLINKKDARLTDKPYTIFFGGNDEEGELSLSGRTDVDMVVSVNPQTGQISIINVPRDSFIPNPYMDNEGDKLTHLGIYGLDNTLDGLGNYLDVDIDYYVLVNFTTFMSIIEALGGVDVDNPYAFEYTWDEDYVYPEGMIHLDGQAALYYVRERYNLPDGDFGRSMHQQLVFKAIINKLTSPALIKNFNGLLSALEGTFLTNLSSSSIYSLCQKQLDDNTQWNIVNYHIEGGFGYEITASESMPLSVVYPYDNQVEFAQDVINKVYAGEILEQDEMPDGSYND